VDQSISIKRLIAYVRVLKSRCESDKRKDKKILMLMMRERKKEKKVLSLEQSQLKA
jgi:hypothetical protein